MQVKSITFCNPSTFFKLPFVIKIFVLSIFERPLKTAFAVVYIFLSLRLNVCYGCSKDDSILFSQHMFWQKNEIKKNICNGLYHCIKAQSLSDRVLDLK